ncbi:MAG: cytochrome b/b6 domain-containing protein [Desulfitobacteriaceae bacterium]|nr:cytochrome b/b6 domain-containing protein [Desulfitobacteriaceae bacterium]MDI6878459.1 cytochrome b/b6 domain-containing protein [Desulfitobacteriaceae bacterium]MDI6913022.1 cytochrome b/b6 domain-containing protein [Desulfitobacteriaceae bacterium]
MTTTTHHWPQRTAHIINLLLMLVLAGTGFYIHRPLVGGLMGLARYAHIVAAFVLLVNLAWRIYYAFLGQYKDAREFKPQLQALPRQIRYYLFLSNHEVKEGLYNPLQRLAYLAVVLLIILQGVTGYALGWPEGTMAVLVNALGLAEIRALHYLITWFLLTFLIVHLYLVLTETPHALSEMFLGRQQLLSTGSPEKHVARDRA